MEIIGITLFGFSIVCGTKTSSVSTLFFVSSWNSKSYKNKIFYLFIFSSLTSKHFLTQLIIPNNFAEEPKSPSSVVLKFCEVVPR